MYLLDTNVISELRKTKPHGAVLAWFDSISSSEISIPAPVIGEIQEGAELTRLQDPSKAAQIEDWLELVLSSFSIIPMDGHMFGEWARLMAGKSDDLTGDAMIAAIAKANRSTVVTRNVKDFELFGVSVLNPFDQSRGELS